MLALLWLVAGCGAPVTRPVHDRPAEAPRPERSEMAQPTGPYVMVLGTAQDAGLPQIGSRSAGSVRARTDRSFRRLAASVLIADPGTGARWLVDATPDIREQVDLAEGHPSTRPDATDRPPLFDGVLLTHAHMGHYTGLLQLGREAYAASNATVLCSARMCELLETNQPWQLLVELGHISLARFSAGHPIALGPSVAATPIEVPHRAELTDTHGFVIRGPRRAVLYVPDIDKWERWDERVEDYITDVDVALLDGTFYSDGEIPGRPMADIPHPFIEESIARFETLPPAERAKIVFTHLNHTNPAADPRGEAAARVRAAGMRVAREGELFEL